MLVSNQAQSCQWHHPLDNFVMRLKEWFSWHFPELGKIITDSLMFVKVVQYIGKRDTITSALDDEGRADKIKDKL